MTGGPGAKCLPGSTVANSFSSSDVDAVSNDFLNEDSYFHRAYFLLFIQDLVISRSNKSYFYYKIIRF